MFNSILYVHNETHVLCTIVLRERRKKIQNETQGATVYHYYLIQMEQFRFIDMDIGMLLTFFFLFYFLLMSRIPIVPPKPPVIYNDKGEAIESRAGPYEEGGDLHLVCVVTGGKFIITIIKTFIVKQ